MRLKPNPGIHTECVKSPKWHWGWGLGESRTILLSNPDVFCKLICSGNINMEPNLRRRDDRPAGADQSRYSFVVHFGGHSRRNLNLLYWKRKFVKTDSKNAVSPFFTVFQSIMSSLGDHESNQRTFRATTIAMAVLAVVFTALRFLARWKKGLRPGIDDYMLVVALVRENPTRKKRTTDDGI